MQPDISSWIVKGPAGYAGARRDALVRANDKAFGPGQWAIAYQWGERVVDRAFALGLYEDAYVEHLRATPGDLEWLLETASNVYDTAESNVASGLDYAVQETAATHLQDIAVRRAVARLGRTFGGTRLVQIRGHESEGYRLNPGRVPFHHPDKIRRDDAAPPLPGDWCLPDSIEAFWQLNKVLVVSPDAAPPVAPPAHEVESDMSLVFLGTSSGAPSMRRNVSGLALRHSGDVYLFDCGEASQHQLMRSTVRMGKIRCVFISHLHGDHVFGLFGLLCTSTATSAPERPPIDIYGPLGLRRLVREALRLSDSHLGCPIRVHELVPRELPANAADLVALGDPLDEELPGRDIAMEAEGDFWVLVPPSDAHPSVRAAPVEHRVPCVGFVFEEPPKAGKLLVDQVQAQIEPFLDQLIEEARAARQGKGKAPTRASVVGPLLGRLKSGAEICMPDGKTMVKAQLGPSTPGRKVVIMGDTCHSAWECGIGAGADVVVHESTLENEREAEAIEKGHSTPGMAGAFAAKLGARSLILTHFSQRYDGSDPDEMGKLVKQAEAAFEGGPVFAAYDLYVHHVHRREN